MTSPVRSSRRNHPGRRPHPNEPSPQLATQPSRPPPALRRAQCAARTATIPAAARTATRPVRRPRRSRPSPSGWTRSPRPRQGPQSWPFLRSDRPGQPLLRPAVPALRTHRRARTAEIRLPALEWTPARHRRRPRRSSGGRSERSPTPKATHQRVELRPSGGRPAARTRHTEATNGPIPAPATPQGSSIRAHRRLGGSRPNPASGRPLQGTYPQDSTGRGGFPTNLSPAQGSTVRPGGERWTTG